MKRILRAAWVNLLRWGSDPKYAAALVAVCLYLWNAYHDLIPYAQSLGHPEIAPYLFPLLPSLSGLITPVFLAYIILIIDAPFRTRHQQFVLQRTGKRIWAAGQIVYILAVSAIFTLALWLLTFLLVLPSIQWIASWGPVLTTAANNGLFVGNYGCMKNIAPIPATLWVAWVMFSVCFLLGMLMMACNLYLPKGTGTTLVAGLAIIPLFLSLFSQSPGPIKRLLWISPLSWMDRSLMGLSNEGLPSYAFAAAAPFLLGCILAAAVLANIHRVDLETDKE